MITLNVFSWFVLLFNYGWTIELLLTYCCSYVDMIAYHTHTHKSKSIITVVEGNGLDCIGQRSKKDDERQDPSLWEIFNFLLKADSLTLPVAKMAFIGKQLNISWDIQLLSNDLTCEAKHDPPSLSPACSSSNLQVLSGFAFLILVICQHLEHLTLSLPDI